MWENSADKINIMIIEDDNIYRESISDLINNSGKLVCDHAYASCEEGLEILSNGFAPQVILLDIELPGISGIEGIPKLKEASPSTHIIMLTVFDDDDNVFNAICHGACGYLLKSATSDEIHKAITEVVKGGAAMSPRVASKVLTMFTRYSQPKKEYGLTSREKEILKLLIDGLNKQHIADTLHVSYFTIDTHIKNIYSKLHVHTQIDVVTKALKEHLI